MGEIVISSNSQKQTQKLKIKRVRAKTEEYAPNAGIRKKTLEKNFNETEISNLPEKEFKETVIIVLNNLESRIEELRKYFKI